MGAWDTTSFANDSASDWLAELVEGGTVGMVDEAIDAVLGWGDDFLEASMGEEAIAAAEVTAWLYGRPGKGTDESENLEGWVEEQEVDEDEGRVERAIRAIDRVFNEPSELRETWEEAEDFEDWKKSLAELKSRLREVE
jgi:hypothetical protein